MQNRRQLDENTVNGLIDFANAENPLTLTQRATSLSCKLLKGPLKIPAYVLTGATTHRLVTGEEYNHNDRIFETGAFLGFAGSVAGAIGGALVCKLTNTSLNYIPLIVMASGAIPFATNFISTVYEEARYNYNQQFSLKPKNL